MHRASITSVLIQVILGYAAVFSRLFRGARQLALIERLSSTIRATEEEFGLRISSQTALMRGLQRAFMFVVVLIQGGRRSSITLKPADFQSKKGDSCGKPTGIHGAILCDIGVLLFSLI